MSHVAIGSLASTLVAFGCAATSREPSDPWRPLFNGRDLAGWDTYIGPKAAGEPPVGLNRDPDGVFTVVEVDGAPAIRVSGQTIGGISTTEELEGFHLRLEYRWGERTWPPRQGLDRDSGILYWAVGPHGAGSGGWLRSVECNVMEDDFGSFWGVAGAVADVEIGEEELAYREDPKVKYPVFQRGGRRVTFGQGGFSGARPSPILAQPRDRWHQAEVIALGGTGIHVLNGQVTLVISNARQPLDGRLVALRRGRIQLQSEGAEVFYRKIEVRPMEAFPKEYEAWVPRAVEAASTDAKDTKDSEDGFVSLFDAEQLPHWRQCGPGMFEVEGGVATGEGGMGLWWYTRRRFGDFTLRGEFLQEAESDSGIFVRFPDPGGDPWIAVKQGHEVEIGENKISKDGTASIYAFQAPAALPLRPLGEWNEYEITCVGRRYRVRLNGEPIVDYDDSAGRPLSGFIGIQNYPYAGKVKHRRVRVREVGGPPHHPLGS
jgi:hypothetical protein